MTWQKGEYQPKQKRADEKKSRILNAALELFAADGFHGTTAKLIAARAGVATGSFYRYFKDKKAVFMALCQRMEEEIGHKIFALGGRMREQGEAEADILQQMIRFSVSLHHRNKAFHREVLAMQILDQDIAAWVRQREGRILEALTEFFVGRQDVYQVEDLSAAAELVYYAIEEVAHRAVLFDAKVGEERLVQALEEMLMRYLLST